MSIIRFILVYEINNNLLTANDLNTNVNYTDFCIIISNYKIILYYIGNTNNCNKLYHSSQ